MGSAERLIVRWLLIAVLTVCAFHRTLASIVAATRGGSLVGGYVWTVLAAGLLAAIAVALQPRRGRAIYDRQTDIIVGLMLLVLAVLLDAVLLARYSTYFDLLRLDLVAMWMFLLSNTVLLFGIRSMFRFIWVWVLLLAIFPLPYQILAIVVLGGGKTSAGAGTLLVAAFAAWICAGADRRRGLSAAALAALTGAAVLAALTALIPQASLLTFQLVPALSAIVVSAVGVFLYSRVRHVKPELNRTVGPLAARQVWAAVPLVTAVAIGLSFVRLPIAVVPQSVTVEGIAFGRPLSIPAGWHQTAFGEYPEVARRLYGSGAVMLRQQITADTGNPKWDKLSQPRTVVVDSITTDSPFTFEVYPSVVVYAAPHARFSEPRIIDLGFGVRAQLVSGTDDRLLVTWNALQWTWQNGHSAQRVLVLSVDNHDDGAPFPQPGHSLPTVLNALLVVLFRGNAAVQNREAEFKDADMLTDIGHTLVRTQLHGMAVPA